MCSLASGTQTEPAEKQCAVCYTDLDLKNTVITQTKMVLFTLIVII